SAARLCDADSGIIRRRKGDIYPVAATFGLTAEQRNHFTRYSTKADRGSVFGRAILEGRTIHVPDLLTDPHLDRTRLQDYARVINIRSGLGVPLVREGTIIGVFTLQRKEPRPFTGKQIELVETFADQAVIAIENARLLNDLNKLNQQLEQRVADQVSEIERMSRLRRFLRPQVADLIVTSGTEKRLESHRREITALFCDLRGFTGFSESSDPEDVMALLREYHAA